MQGPGDGRVTSGFREQQRDQSGWHVVGIMDHGVTWAYILCQMGAPGGL